MLGRFSPLAGAALRGYHTAADARLPEAVAVGHRHRHRGQPHHLCGTRPALRSHPKLGLRGAFRHLRARPAGGVRTVGRCMGRRDGQACAADHRIVRSCGGVGSAVAAGRAVDQQRLGSDVLAGGTAGLLRDQLADTHSRHLADRAGRPTAGSQLAELHGVSVRRHRRAAAGRCDAALGRPVHAVSDRRDHLHRAALGDDSTCADSTQRCRRRLVRLGLSARYWTGSATWPATRWC